MVITSNILQRTFQIRHGGKVGTCFVVDLDAHQYIVTATHVVATLPECGTVGLATDSGTQEVSVRLVGHCKPPTDVAVLAPERPLVYSRPIRVSNDGMGLAESVFFLGFPHGWHTAVGGMNGGFPLPLVKKGIVSGFGIPESAILLDARNNPGFSGGPVVSDQLSRKAGMPVVIGIVSGFRCESEPVIVNGQKTSLPWKQNTGIMVAGFASRALDVIRANPIGAPLK